MSETHLPECEPMLRDLTGEWVDEVTGEAECCICAALRACEARVRDEEFRLLPKYRYAYAAGIAAAREAVAGWKDGMQPPEYNAALADALAAIDALTQPSLAEQIAHAESCDG